MKEDVEGKYGKAIIFTDNIEKEAIKQVKTICDMPYSKNCDIRIMPDVHAGIGCVIGFTGNLNQIVPSLVGVDSNCLDMDTEVLTQRGWVKICKYSGDDILIYNKLSDEAYFSRPYAYINEPCDEFLHFKNSKGLDQMVSNEHKMLVFKGYKKRGYETQDYTPNELLNCNLSKGYYGFKTSFNFKSKGKLNITDNQIRLDIMMQADGYIRKENRYALHFSKERKIKRAKELLETEGINYKIYHGKDNTTYIEFYSDFIFNKDLSKYYNASKEQLKVVTEECLFWDGNISSRSSYCNCNKNNSDVIQFAFASNNTRAGITTISNKIKNKNWNDCYRVIPTKNNIVGYYCNVEKIKSKDGRKYCFTTETGYFVARRNNKIFITGNCGVLDVPLGKVDLDLKALDQIVNDKIPSGFNVHEEPLVNYKIFGRLMDKFGLSEDKQFHINCSIGTLGGGNHFIEVDENDDGFKHLLIHSGSRNLGQQIFRYYNNIAKDNDTRSAVTKLIYELKEEGCQKEIQEQIKNLKCTKYPKDLIPLPIEYTSDYLNDMTTVRRYARINREVMAMQILNEIPEINTSDALCLSTETLHNYVDSYGMIRKGAVSAESGQHLVIPLNMKDGALLCVGKGNQDWNKSAPHGAGRLMSRKQAREDLSLDNYKELMKDIYSSSVCEETLDEAPLAYKSIDDIVGNIEDTVIIKEHIKPIYNFKDHSKRR